MEPGGVKISAGDMIWVALASAHTDAGHYDHPFAFDVHRPDPVDCMTSYRQCGRGRQVEGGGRAAAASAGADAAAGTPLDRAGRRSG
jgi:cytochrome P450